MSVEKALKLAKEHGAKYVDIMFGDRFGTLQHFTITARRLVADLFTEACRSTAPRSAVGRASRSRT